VSEFVGRTGSLRVYSYPEPRFSGNSLPFARNFALGTKTARLATDGIQIPWNSIDVPPVAPITPCGVQGCVDVPITPLSTGIVLVSGTISLVNGGVAPTTVTVTVQVNGVTLPVPSYVTTIVNGARAVIPILAETTPGETPVGVTSFIEIFVIGDTISVEPDGSSLGLQEVSVATG